MDISRPSEAGELDNIIAHVTQPLEKALMQEGIRAGLGEDLQLRYSYCGVATAALQCFLLERHHIDTERMVTQPEIAPRLINQRRMAHVVLQYEGVTIDPTYSQFMSYVGLSPTVVLQNETLRGLYPPRKIATFNTQKSDEFADTFADIAHTVDEVMGAQLGAQLYGLNENLIGTTLDTKRDVYRAIWDSGGYSPLPLREQSSLQGWVGRIAARMNDEADVIEYGV